MKPFYWALLTAVVWGCVPILEKLGLEKVPVLPGLFYRSLGVFFGASVLLIFMFPQIKEVFSAHPGSWPYLVFGGFLASFVGQICFYHALKHGEASWVVPVAGTYPLVSFILGVLFLSEQVTVAKIGGLSCIIFGIFLLR